MTRTFVYSISAEESGTKITDYLRNHGYSRHILTCLKHTDDTVLVNGLGVYMNYVLQPDDRLTIVIPEETPSEHIVPVNLPFPVVYEDEDLMIINKPSDMPIHRSIIMRIHSPTLLPGILGKKEKPLFIAASTDWTVIPPDF